MRERQIKFGVQTRIDLWSEEMLDLLGRGGVRLDRGGRGEHHRGGPPTARQEVQDLDGRDQRDRLIHAKQRVPFVQANLLDSRDDDPERRARPGATHLHEHGVWANKPVPLFPYPGSPDYTRRWGAPDDRAWERAHDFYLGSFDEFSDIQEQRPAPLVQLESTCMIRSGMRVLMTGDTVGGVWTFTMELAEALGAHGIDVVLAAMGAPPSRAQRAEAARDPQPRACSRATSSWSGWTTRGGTSTRAGEWLLGSGGAVRARRRAPQFGTATARCLARAGRGRRRTRACSRGGRR